MLIIPQDNTEKVQIRIRISQDTLEQISEYCEWADLKTKDYFIEQACQYIFSNDLEWQNRKKQR